MLHDLLTSLLGLEGDFIRKVEHATDSDDKTSCVPLSFELSPLASSRLSDSQVLSIKPLLELARLYHKVSAAVENVLTSAPEPQPKPYHFTLADTINSAVLEPYRDRVCDIEGTLLQHDGLMPVTYLVAQLRDQLEILNFFSSLLDDTRDVRGCLLLDHLWSRYHNLPSGSAARVPLGLCLDAVGDLFLSMLSKWVSFGQGPMLPDVFFIAPSSKDLSTVETESATSSAIELARDLVPRSIISMALAEKVLLCGSAVRVLGLCIVTDDSSKNAENLGRLRQLKVLFDNEADEFKMTANGCVRYLEASVERARNLLNGWLRGAVSPTLLEHLSAIRGLYLLGDGAFWQTFLEECMELTTTRRGNVTEYDLAAGPWQLALAEHYADQSHQVGFATIRLMPLGFSFSSKSLFNSNPMNVTHVEFVTRHQHTGSVPIIDWELACKSSLSLAGTARLGGQGAAELLRLGSSGQCWVTSRQLVGRGRFGTELEFIAPERSSSSSPGDSSMRVVLTSEGNRLPSTLASGKVVSPGYRTTVDDSSRTHTLVVSTETIKIDEVLVCELRLPSSTAASPNSQGGWKLDGLGCCFVGVCTTDSSNGNTYLEILKWSHSQPEARAGPATVSWLDRVVVVYDVPWPLPLVIGAEEFTKYSVIFRALLSLRHSALGLDNLWQTLTSVARKRREPTALPWISQILALRARMASWLSTIIQYFTIDVISVRYAELVKRVSISTTDFDGIVQAHRAFLDDVTSKCFLEPSGRSRKIRSSIDKLSKACMKLSALGKQGIFDDTVPSERLGRALKSLEDKFVVGVRDLISLLDDMHLTSSERAHSLAQLLLRLDYNETYSNPHQQCSGEAEVETPTVDARDQSTERGKEQLAARMYDLAVPVVRYRQASSTAGAGFKDGERKSQQLRSTPAEIDTIASTEQESVRHTRQVTSDTTHLDYTAGPHNMPPNISAVSSLVRAETSDEDASVVQAETSKVLSAYEKSKALLESIRRRKLLRSVEETEEQQQRPNKAAL
ncbi:Gamma-tubulin complex component 4 [Perkinsus chesapeaki]|uniref:Spindle pole body component n=1 Tax=Perkinsus chesapeaki TaxID=330153 RepID=A0A7J6LZA3_PERCH|nr:Gamma-tubulin complex component 4 [Perkinsus chesapeaki]